MTSSQDEKVETRIFLSWSGPASHDIAIELKQWIRYIIQAAQPWMSNEDIAPGKNWFGAISEEITQSKIGIICVTKENQYSPWLLWEAGALYAGFRDSQLVVPLLINLDISELVPPLRHFQVVNARNREDMFRMLKGICELMPTSIRPTEEMIDVQMDHFWNRLQDTIADALRVHQVAEPLGNGSVRTFGDAAEQFLEEQKGGPSHVRDQHALRRVGPYINHLPVNEVTNGALAQFKKDRLDGDVPQTKGGKKVKPAMIGTINKELRTVSAILNRAVKEWRWMPYAPTIRQLTGESKKQYILTWAEQDRILQCLPEYLRAPMLFALNTGLRRNEIRQISWNQMETDTFGDSNIAYFLVPIGHTHKKVVVLNTRAREIIEDQRGKNEEFVFTTDSGEQLKNFGDNIWLRAWIDAGLPSDNMTLKGVENLRHTFSHRLRHAGVSQDDIDMLMGSTKAHILKRYLQPDIGNLLKMVEKIDERREVPIVRH